MKPQAEQTPASHNSHATMGVVGILNDIARLSPVQQQQLFKAWLAVSPEVAGSTELRSAEDSPLVDEAASRVAIVEWLSQIATMTPRQRLSILDAHRMDAEFDWEVEILDQAIRDLIKEHPLLSIQRAAFKFATEHPILMFIAVIGFLLPLFRFGSLGVNVVRQLINW